MSAMNSYHVTDENDVCFDKIEVGFMHICSCLICAVLGITTTRLRTFRLQIFRLL